MHTKRLTYGNVKRTDMTNVNQFLTGFWATIRYFALSDKDLTKLFDFLPAVYVSRGETEAANNAANDFACRERATYEFLFRSWRNRTLEEFETDILKALTEFHERNQCAPKK